MRGPRYAGTILDELRTIELGEDPDFLTGPATLTQQWDHRPDLEFAQNTGACDPEVARRYKEHVPAE